jgi:two-component sensor histidine kinase
VAIEIGPLDEAVALCWTETGGPQVTAAGGKGFGATLIEMSVTRQLGGRLRYDWRPEGLRVEARIPKQMMAR